MVADTLLGMIRQCVQALVITFVVALAALVWIMQEEFVKLQQSIESMSSKHQKELSNVDQQIITMKREITLDFMKTISEVQQRSQGSVYIRWGRSNCPSNGTELVYNGFTSGSWNDHEGGSVNYVCLPHDPIWAKYNELMHDNNQNIHGVEYNSNSINIPGTPFDSSLNGHNVPCAVCHSITRSAILRIPGRNKCYDGWHLEYSGYLMAGLMFRKAATEYACVDESPERVSGGKQSQGGKYLSPVEAHCGYSLMCPPYIHGRELTCAVCTK